MFLTSSKATEKGAHILFNRPQRNQAEYATIPNFSQALATTTLNSMPTLAYVDVEPSTNMQQGSCGQRAPKRRGQERGVETKNGSNTP